MAGRVIPMNGSLTTSERLIGNIGIHPNDTCPDSDLSIRQPGLALGVLRTKPEEDLIPKKKR